MATSLNYSAIIKKVLIDNIGVFFQDLKNEPVFDDEHKKYMLITKGINHTGKSIYDVLCSISINQDGKVVLEYNRSDNDFIDLLVSEGIPATDIN